MNEIKQIQYVMKTLPLALETGDTFNFNPLVIMAQGALESGWGLSNLAVNHNNYFGITAYGVPNDYWHGGQVRLKSRCGEMRFRKYATAQDSFNDFGRLILHNYRMAWSVSNDIDAYAEAIAHSNYISIENGDSRIGYAKSIKQLGRRIRSLVYLLENEKKALNEQTT